MFASRCLAGPPLLLSDGGALAARDGSSGSGGAADPQPQPVPTASQPDHDRRFVPCRPPAINTAGEQTLAVFDLVFDPVANCYQPPLQVKATSGMLLMNDFGHRQIRCCHVLDRRIVPPEQRINEMTLRAGE